MAALDTYADRYPNVHLQRTDGILVMRLHTGGGPLVWSGEAHRDLGLCFTDIAADRENEVLIITGTGDAFLEAIEPMPPIQLTATMWDHLLDHGIRLLSRLLEIPVPVIGAVNGAATLHGELALLSDVVICTEDAAFGDPEHFHAGYVPGDGAHVIWPLLLGLNRARHLLMTGRRISADEALSLGLVAEVVDARELMPRAEELAREILRRSPLARRYTRMALTHEVRLQLQRSLGYGLALEGLAALEHMPGAGEFR
jgi:enoyl-CoA hydratase/carnithine racemase